MSVLEQTRAQLCRIEAKVNHMALDMMDDPAPLPDNVQLPLANMQDVDNLEAALKEPGNAVEQSLVCNYVPKTQSAWLSISCNDMETKN